MVIPSDKRQCLIESSMSERVSQLCDSVLGEPMATASHKLMFGDIHLHKNEYTMVGVQRLKNFAASIAEVNREKIPGAIVELGVWRRGIHVLQPKPRFWPRGGTMRQSQDRDGA